MRRLARLLTLAALLDTGCTEREHANPFDPANPSTGGRPAGFAAIAGDGRATLRWQAAAAAGLVGYQVFRSLDPASGFTPISTVLPPTQDQLLDAGLLNGTDHYYRLHFVFDAGLGPLYSSDVATPGPQRPWVTDFNVPALYLLAPDARHVSERIAGAATVQAGDVDVDLVTGAVWTCDPFFGDVTIYDPGTGSLTHTVSGVSSPVAVAVDRIDHTAWVGNDADNEVRHLSPDGTLATPPAIASTSGPIGLALDPEDESIWICERRGNRVRHHDKDGVPIGTAFVIAPSRVAVDSVTGDAWVTSFTRGKILRLSAAAVAMDSFTSVRGPVNIAVDWRRGRIWVTDPNLGELVALRRNGSVEFVVPRLGGVFDVALDLVTGEAWVTLQDAGRVAKISPAGVVLRQLDGFDTPNGIALDPGVR